MKSSTKSPQLINLSPFAFHGYEGMIRDIFFNHRNHNLGGHGYRENGDITTPFDMRVMSELDRFHLAQDAANAALGMQQAFAAKMDETIAFHHDYIRENGTTFRSSKLEMENVNK